MRSSERARREVCKRETQDPVPLVSPCPSMLSDWVSQQSVPSHFQLRVP